MAERRVIEPANLAISIVIYSYDFVVLKKVFKCLELALNRAKYNLLEVKIILINNSVENNLNELHDFILTRYRSYDYELEILGGQGNIGYGAANNLAIRKTDYEFHIFMNPDVLIEEDALVEALIFMRLNPEVGLVAPAAVDMRGNPQYLCKRYPTILDLGLRGAPFSFLKKFFQERLNYYELRDVIGQKVVFDVPITSGCFMFFRRSTLTKIQGFSPSFFLYFEDFDISLRAARVARIAYVPAVRIVHFGGHAAKKGWRHIFLFLQSAVIFFKRYGWKWA